jgi:uncharacterized protein (TIGR02444 family)
VRTYAKPGVAEACLALQNRHGLDVNMLLFAVWAGNQGSILPESAIAEAIARVYRWHTGIVRPLRSLRHLLKADPHGVDPEQAAALRARISAIELDAEHIEQLAIADLLPAPDSNCAVSATQSNIAAYARVVALSWSEADRRHLATIVAAASRP